VASVENSGTAAANTMTISNGPSDNARSEESAEIKLLRHLPRDFVLRKSITIEANFELRGCIQELRKRQRTPLTKNAQAGLWKLHVSSNLDGKRDSRDSSYGINKKSLQGDMLWLKQVQNRVVGEDPSGDGVRSHVICWQEALESLTAQYFEHVTPVFYALGSHLASFRVIFYQKLVSSSSEMRYECIIHRCTTGMFDDLRSLGIPMQVLGTAGAVHDLDVATSSIISGAKGGMQSSYKDREKLNLFSDSSRRSRHNTTDKIIYLSGNKNNE
jgi:hypothetical protein